MSDPADEVIRSVLSMISGKWKVPIIRVLSTKGDTQFNQLVRELDGISARILTIQLKELSEDGLVIRMEFGKEMNRNPPEVLYALSYKGASLIPILAAMGKWGTEHNPEKCDRISFDGPGMDGYPIWKNVSDIK
jgi:DNA-binding HxlR family transcriptional regulator